MIRSPQESEESIRVSQEHSDKSKKEYEDAMKTTDAKFTVPETPSSKSKVPNNYVTKNQAPKLDESLFECVGKEKESIKPQPGEELTENEDELEEGVLGTMAGKTIGSKLGTAVGSLAGPVGAGIGNKIGSAIGGFAGDKIGDAVGSTIDNKVGDGTSSNLASTVSSGLSGISGVEDTASTTADIPIDMQESYQFKIANERINRYNEGLTESTFNPTLYLENLVKKSHLSFDEAFELKKRINER